MAVLVLVILPLGPVPVYGGTLPIHWIQVELVVTQRTAPGMSRTPGGSVVPRSERWHLALRRWRGQRLTHLVDPISPPLRLGRDLPQDRRRPRR